MRRTKTDRAAVKTNEARMTTASETVHRASFMLKTLATEKRRAAWHETKESALRSTCRALGLSYRQGLRIIRADLSRIYADVYQNIEHAFTELEAISERAAQLQIERNTAILRGTHAGLEADTELDCPADTRSGMGAVALRSDVDSTCQVDRHKAETQA